MAVTATGIYGSGGQKRLDGVCRHHIPHDEIYCVGRSFKTNYARAPRSCGCDLAARRATQYSAVRETFAARRAWPRRGATSGFEVEFPDGPDHVRHGLLLAFAVRRIIGNSITM